MNILYGIQGTGNGHISRGRYIYDLLKKYAVSVDVLVSGNNYSLKHNIPVRYTNQGFTFSVYNGKIDYLKTLVNLDLFTSFSQQKDIPFQKYDLIITDFEPVTAWAGVRYKIPSIHISHQASFINNNVPRPLTKSILGEYVMKYFCPSNDYIGLHYQKYGDDISEPIISERIKKSRVELKDHITIYLPWFEDDYLFAFFQQLNDFKFQIFSKNINKIKNVNNITFFPVDEFTFPESIRTCSGVICNAGFQTSSEVIYLGKRLLVVPIEGQYEQLCNVAALKKIGINSISRLDNNSLHIIRHWMNSQPIQIKFQNNLEDILASKLNNLK